MAAGVSGPLRVAEMMLDRLCVGVGVVAVVVAADEVGAAPDVVVEAAVVVVVVGCEPDADTTPLSGIGKVRSCIDLSWSEVITGLLSGRGGGLATAAAAAVGEAAAAATGLTALPVGTAAADGVVELRVCKSAGLSDLGRVALSWDLCKTLSFCSSSTFSDFMSTLAELE
jgi:hypothetical protein